MLGLSYIEKQARLFDISDLMHATCVLTGRF